MRSVVRSVGRFLGRLSSSGECLQPPPRSCSRSRAQPARAPRGTVQRLSLAFGQDQGEPPGRGIPRDPELLRPAYGPPPYAPFLLEVDQTQPVPTLPDHQVHHQIASMRQEAYQVSVHGLDPSSVAPEECRLAARATPTRALPAWTRRRSSREGSPPDRSAGPSLRESPSPPGGDPPHPCGANLSRTVHRRRPGGQVTGTSSEASRPGPQAPRALRASPSPWPTVRSRR